MTMMRIIKKCTPAREYSYSQRVGAAARAKPKSVSEAERSESEAKNQSAQSANEETGQNFSLYRMRSEYYARVNGEQREEMLGWTASSLPHTPLIEVIFESPLTFTYEKKLMQTTSKWSLVK